MKRDPFGPPPNPVEERLSRLSADVAKPWTPPPEAAASPPKTAGRTFRKKTVLATPAEIRTAEALCHELSARIGAPLNYSLMTRTLWKALQAALAASGGGEAPPRLTRPANHDAAALEAFEGKVSDYLRGLLKSVIAE
ncbi:MAG: hypothetical protein ACRDD1_05175 [Planctomycetia bacterium]